MVSTQRNSTFNGTHFYTFFTYLKVPLFKPYFVRGNFFKLILAQIPLVWGGHPRSNTAMDIINESYGRTDQTDWLFVLTADNRRFGGT